MDELNLKLPTESDWDQSYRCLDTQSAYAHLAGKTYDEAVALFRKRGEIYIEDLMVVPVPCFSFYTNACMDYLLSPCTEGDSDGANWFVSIIEQRVGDFHHFDTAFINKVINTLQHIVEQQVWYDACPTIYGDFGDRYASIMEKLRAKKLV